VNTKFSNILKGITIGFILLCASDYAYSRDIYICASQGWGKGPKPAEPCQINAYADYGVMGVQWINAESSGICEQLGGIDLTNEAKRMNLYNKLVINTCKYPVHSG
jgi:hypothetical protein